MNKEERELIELKFTNMHATIKSNHDMEMLKLDNIEQHVTRTNGRVDQCEEKIRQTRKETRVVRFLESRPIIAVLIMLGLIVLYSVFGVSEIVKMIK